jgi:mono/diheme cytochrome c family protein
MRFLVLVHALVLVICVAGADPAEDRTQFPPTYMPSGEQMYKQYCAACHGADARGHGPAASFLTTPPPDLTTLAKRHLGKFPFDYVSNVLKFGTGPSAHGSSDMPTWGPIFRYFDNQNERVVQQRIKNLCDYLASLQEH